MTAADLINKALAEIGATGTIDQVEQQQLAEHNWQRAHPWDGERWEVSFDEYYTRCPLPWLH
jgi:hypothetical protein